MKIVWDEPKRASNLDRRGFDFADIGVEFLSASTIIPAKAGRRKAIGEFGGMVITVIIQPLGSEAIALVSMRRASRNERKVHEK